MQVKWKKEARKVLCEIMVYSELNFGEKAAILLYREVSHCASLLSNNPFLGKEEPLLAHRKKGYRSIVVSKNFKLIYRLTTDAIVIVAIINCRQDFKSFVLRLKN